MYLANKKHISQTTQQDGNDKANLEEKQEKNGIDNKAYEAEERNKPTSKVDANSHEEVNTNLNQSQIEMGFTESMLCTSKL
uniref:Uncharacterized protein n=1 Tax=Pararge aegeria TaxID=116150 RepID=S4NUP4_9NEOP